MRKLFSATNRLMHGAPPYDTSQRAGDVLGYAILLFAHAILALAPFAGIGLLTALDHHHRPIAHMHSFAPASIHKAIP